MNSNTTSIERYELPMYLILTPLISLAIAFFLPIPTEVIALLMVFVPVLMALLLSALAEGGRGVTELLKKLFQWRISFKWYVITLLMPVGIIVCSAVLAVILGWSPSVQLNIPERSMLIVNSIIILLAAVLEEFGWRGYALPRLFTQRSPLSSALLIGIAHGLLHIGLGFSAGRPLLPTFLVPFLSSVIWTWLFVHTRGSLVIAILYHFVIDYTPQFFLLDLTISQALWVQTIVNLIVALVLILVFGVKLQRDISKESLALSAE
jgi:membrane protease YdiL (CAAX protease family)